jgi:hypothetical protein
MHHAPVDISALPPATGQIVTTHWNLHKQIYSVKRGKDPVYYTPQLVLSDCVFIIDKRLREKFTAKRSRRTVHALIKGRLVSYDAQGIDGETVRCNPFLFDSFVRASDKKKVVAADKIVLHRDKRIEARGLRLG